MGKFLGKLLLGPPHLKSLSIVGSKHERLIGYLTILCLILWGVGIILPMVTTEKMILFHQQYSVLGFIRTLFAESNYVLALVVLLLGVASPLIKFVQMYRMWRWVDASDKLNSRRIKQIDVLSKWSTGDVFVVAILVAIMKTSGIFADAHVGPGLYFYTTAIFGSMALSHWLKRAIEQRSFG